MKVVVQRVAQAKVEIDNEVSGSINKGLLLYVCLEVGDTKDTVITCVEKLSKLRIFEDDQGRMNKSVLDIEGQILSVSQFTLSWNGKKGHRPSFDASMPPKEACELYEFFNESMRDKDLEVQTGRFGADMKVGSVNDGPVTFHLSF
ncbi:MAG: D-tyrosyl-tRNA(Tyr) deacylase [Bacteriovoracaceae bacterium]|nr:D-tyrosyl-tRNA(Tyr) deacylase [Bacteriovoracaceae bacterium]